MKKTKRPRLPKADVTLGRALRDARLAKSMSQNDLATLMGYQSLQFVSDWERGRAPIPMKRLAEIAKHLDIPRDKLFELLLRFSVERVERSLRQEYRQLRGKKA